MGHVKRMVEDRRGHNNWYNKDRLKSIWKTDVRKAADKRGMHSKDALHPPGKS